MSNSLLFFKLRKGILMPKKKLGRPPKSSEQKRVGRPRTENHQKLQTDRKAGRPRIPHDQKKFRHTIAVTKGNWNRMEILSNNLNCKSISAMLEEIVGNPDLTKVLVQDWGKIQNQANNLGFKNVSDFVQAIGSGQFKLTPVEDKSQAWQIQKEEVTRSLVAAQYLQCDVER